MSGKFRSPPQGLSVRDIIIGQHQSIGGNIVCFHLFFKKVNSVQNIPPADRIVLHCLKALLHQETELFIYGIAEIFRPHAFLLPGADQCKSIKPDPSSGSDFTVQLADGTAAEISGVFVFCRLLRYALIDLLKVGIADHRLPPQHQLSPERNPQGQIDKSSGIVGNDLPDLAVAPGNRFFQLSVPVCQNNGQAVQLPAQNALLLLQPVPEVFPALGLVQGQHGCLMPLFRQFLHGLIAHIHRRTVGQHNACFLLQLLQFIIQAVIFPVAHDFLVLGIIRPGGLIQNAHQIFDPFHSLRLHLSQNSFSRSAGFLP